MANHTDGSRGYQLAQSYLTVPNTIPTSYPEWNPKFKVGNYIKTLEGVSYKYQKITSIDNVKDKQGLYVFDDNTRAIGPHVDNGNTERNNGQMRHAAELSYKEEAEAAAKAEAEAEAKAEAIRDKKQKIDTLLTNEDVRKKVYDAINISNPIKTKIVRLTHLHPWNVDRNYAAIREYLENLDTLDDFNKYLKPGGKPRSRKTKKRTGKKSIKNKRKSNRHRRR